MATNATILASVMASGRAKTVQSVIGLALEQAGQRRQQHQHQHRGDILDDQPADRDASAFRFDQPALLHRLEQDDGAGNRECKPEDQSTSDGPAERIGERHPEQRRQRDLADRAGNRDGAHRQKVAEREMQADAEHQQDHADLGELIGDVLVGDKSRRERPDDDAGQQIAHQRRDFQPLRHRTEREGEDEAGHQRGDERCRMGHPEDEHENDGARKRTRSRRLPVSRSDSSCPGSEVLGTSPHTFANFGIE